MVWYARTAIVTAIEGFGRTIDERNKLRYLFITDDDFVYRVLRRRPNTVRGGTPAERVVVTIAEIKSDKLTTAITCDDR